MKENSDRRKEHRFMSKQPVGGLFVLFGGTGDLAKRELLPALHQLYQQGQLSTHFALVGASRTEMTDEEYRDLARDAVKKGANYETLEEDFFNHIFYQAADNTKLEDFEQLSAQIQEAAKEFETDNAYVYYYSISPSLYDETTTNLKESGMLDIEGNHRVVVEKPFGENLESAEEYYALFNRVFNKEQIYLIDHFAGMDFVQNILTTRYDTPALEAVWNKDYIENIQISLPENLSIGTRGSFYDENGALLDMFQNHLLQILTTVAMDLPETLNEADIKEQKVALLKTIPTFTHEEVASRVIRGQYAADDEGKFNAYRDEQDVPADSLTETYIAVQLNIQSDRWQGVPFYVRTGKALVEDYTVVDVVLKNRSGQEFENQNRLTFAVRPATGVSVVLNQHNPETENGPVTTFIGPDKDTFSNLYVPQAYENLLHDALEGDELYFTTYSEIKEQWRITDSIRKIWRELPPPAFPNYRANSFGPEEADELLVENGHEWIRRVQG